MIMRESIVMKIHYGTALGAVFLVAIHIMMRMTQDFHESLQYENVIANLPWAIAFPNGLPPTNIAVHPTQLYEMSAYFIIFFYLRYRKRNQTFSGEIIFEYLFLGGLSRFMVEFIRTNTKYIFGLSGAQYFSILMMVIGAYQLWKMRRLYNSTAKTIS